MKTTFKENVEITTLTFVSLVPIMGAMVIAGYINCRFPEDWPAERFELPVWFHQECQVETILE